MNEWLPSMWFLSAVYCTDQLFLLYFANLIFTLGFSSAKARIVERSLSYVLEMYKVSDKMELWNFQLNGKEYI